ncbi:non-structural maintenance of chromosomes element 3 homolog [Cephus cinctus]|uniref:Non-structural maintenance of chromosomes element 3 homolog n=1 Tax=Cephus cinctus TaxID=211228 RepID=A0AAJ7BYR3_CEPCN|nr:non-structural maintenance of chromosomes element 3 homolog [Cephus cinctus]
MKMSQRSRRTLRSSQFRQVDSDFDDDDSPPKSQKRRRPNHKQASQSRQSTTLYDLDEVPSQGSQRSKAIQLTSEELSHLVSSVIRYIFTVNHSKTVIQRKYIVDNILTNHSKHYQCIMTEVESQLLKVFGYKLVHINESKYILINDVPNSTPHLTFRQKERSESVLLLLILSHIMALGDACKEDTLWAFLQQLEIVGNKYKEHPYFGDVETLVTVEFMKQHYLVKVRINDSDPPKYEYRWGIRAQNELSKDDVRDFMSKIYGCDLPWSDMQ